MNPTNYSFGGGINNNNFNPQQRRQQQPRQQQSRQQQVQQHHLFPPMYQGMNNTSFNQPQQQQHLPPMYHGMNNPYGMNPFLYPYGMNPAYGINPVYGMNPFYAQQQMHQFQQYTNGVNQRQQPGNNNRNNSNNNNNQRQQPRNNHRNNNNYNRNNNNYNRYQNDNNNNINYDNYAPKKKSSKKKRGKTSVTGTTFPNCALTWYLYAVKKYIEIAFEPNSKCLDDHVNAREADMNSACRDCVSSGHKKHIFCKLCHKSVCCNGSSHLVRHWHSMHDGLNTLCVLHYIYLSIISKRK